MKEYKKKGGVQMAIRKKTTATKELGYKNEICDNCELSEWVTHLLQHFDHAWKPICLMCPHEQYFIVRGRRACQHFVKIKE